VPVEAAPAAQARADELGLRMAARLMDEVEAALPRAETRSAARTPSGTRPIS
jgi:hypothetical protein